MARDEKRRQKALTRKKNKDKERRKTRTAVHSSNPFFDNASKGAIRSGRLHECLCAKQLFEVGIGNIIVSRKLADGRIAIGVFLTDVFCLGVKDAMILVLPLESQYNEIIRRSKEMFLMDKCDVGYARKAIDGAVEYARSLGFSPHHDFERASVIFGDVDGSNCRTEFAYGKNGKPLYIMGSTESSTVTGRIVTLLKQRLGEDGYGTQTVDDSVKEVSAHLGGEDVDDTETSDTGTDASTTGGESGSGGIQPAKTESRIGRFFKSLLKP